MPRGILRIYLGAAPGVGKTFAMLGEAHRRLSRGTDVVVGLVETHGRAHTAEQIEGLEVLPGPRSPIAVSPSPSSTSMRCSPAVPTSWSSTSSRTPMRPVPGTPSAGQDIEQVLDAGISVLTTVNVQHLESLNDVVQQITGVPQRETVPDAVVRRADQIELVDMSPEALRRRLAHGNVYAAEKIDAAMRNYFRVGNLTALRELALLWLADRVDEGLRRYKTEHAHRPRVGGAGTRGRRPDRRAGGRDADPARGPDRRPLRPRQRDRPARGARAGRRRAGGRLDDGPGAAAAPGGGPRRQLPPGGRRRHPERAAGLRARRGGHPAGASAPAVARRLARAVRGRDRRGGGGASGEIDVHLVTHAAAGGRGLRLPPLTGSLNPRRRWLGLLMTVVGVPALTVLCLASSAALSLASVMLVFLLLVVAVALIGGLWPALVAAVVSGLVVNWFFTPPTGRLTVARVDDLVALGAYLLSAVAVATVVDRSARRAADASRSRAETAMLASLSRSVLAGDRELPQPAGADPRGLRTGSVTMVERTDERRADGRLLRGCRRATNGRGRRHRRAHAATVRASPVRERPPCARRLRRAGRRGAPAGPAGRAGGRG